MKKFVKHSSIVALVCILTLLLSVCGNTVAPALTAQNAVKASEITVSASSTVRLVPDKATISFGVTTQERTAELAQSKNSEAVDHVIEVLTSRGVEASRLKAEALAAAGGKPLGEVVAITEGWQDTSARYGTDMNTRITASKAEAFDMTGGSSIQPGETEISANVTVSYSMKYAAYKTFSLIVHGDHGSLNDLHVYRLI